MPKAIKREDDPDAEQRVPGYDKRSRRAAFAGKKFADLTKDEREKILRLVAIELGIIED